MKSRTYRFTEKDPVCGEVMSLVDQAGLKGKQHVGKIAILATLAKGTVDALLYGPTKRPHNATVMSIATSLGFERTWQRTTNKFDLEAELERARAYIRAQRKLIEKAPKKKAKKRKTQRKGHLRLVA